MPLDVANHTRPCQSGARPVTWIKRFGWARGTNSRGGHAVSVYKPAARHTNMYSVLDRYIVQVVIYSYIPRLSSRSQASHSPLTRDGCRANIVPQVCAASLNQAPASFLPLDRATNTRSGLHADSLHLIVAIHNDHVVVAIKERIDSAQDASCESKECI